LSKQLLFFPLLLENDVVFPRLLPDGIELEGVDVNDLVWLEEIPPPENFVVIRGEYKGPVPKKP